MCLQTKDPSIKVAKNDMNVYKTCLISDNIAHPSHANMHGFFYILDIEAETLHLNPNEGLVWNKAANTAVPSGIYGVNEGYHSYNVPSSKTNALFVIPRGASYIDGTFNGEKGIRNLNRVSSSIIFKGFKRYSKFQRLLIRLKLAK